MLTSRSFLFMRVISPFFFNFMIFIFKKYKAFNLLYLLLLLVQLVAAQDRMFNFGDVVKPLLLLSLVMFFIFQTNLQGRFHRRLLTGLLFFLLASVLLLRSEPGNSYWTYAHLAAVFGIIFYIRAFYLDFRSAQELDKKNARIAIVACSIFGMAFYLFLRPYLGLLKLPVMTYTFIICILLMMAVFRNLRVNRESFNLIFIGAILLLLATCLYAYHHFVQPFHLPMVMSIFFYTVAHYLIVMGGAERKLLHQD